MAKIMNVKQQTRRDYPLRAPTEVSIPEIPKQEKMLEIPNEIPKQDERAPMQEKILEPPIPEFLRRSGGYPLPPKSPPVTPKDPTKHTYTFDELNQMQGPVKNAIQPLQMQGPVKNAIQPLGMKRGGAVRSKPQTKFASGGSTNSASKRGDGIAQRGKTKGRMC